MSVANCGVQDEKAQEMKLEGILRRKRAQREDPQQDKS